MKLLRHLTHVLWGRALLPRPGAPSPGRRYHSQSPFAKHRFSHRPGRVRQGPYSPRRATGGVVAFHGTPSVGNAQSIVRHGFMTGQGNGLADGLYFSRNPATAKTYAGSSGVLVRCLVRLGRTCVWSPGLQHRFSAWCQARSISSDNSAKTAWLLHHGFDTLQNGDVIVVLTPQFANPAAWKRKDRRIRVLSIHRAADDRRLHV